MWKANDVIAWRGIYRDCIWHALSTIVVKDSPEGTVLALLPGAECIASKGYLNGKANAQRRWDFKSSDWNLQKFTWHTNRLLIIGEPAKYYSIMHFWDDKSNEFLCYYVNFQLPLQRSHVGLDTLDLDLDLIVNPDHSIEWKDLDEYQKSIETGIILPEWVEEIEIARNEVLDRLEKCEYPFDNSWLNWRPDPNWSAPKFPKDWDKI